MKTENVELVAYLQRLLGDEYHLFRRAQTEPPTIRVNTLKQSVRNFKRKLQSWSVSFQPHPYHKEGMILRQDALPLSHTVAFFRGEFFYHGIASQLPALALQPQPGETILDIAAAPGSKATQIAAMMKNRGYLWLNDSSGKRLQPLLANLAAAGTIHDVLTCLPGQTFGRQLPEFFDRALVDAPCSALNIFPRRMALSRWSKGYLDKISAIQEQLLISAVKAVKVGGVIVYATCSICPEENERVIDRIRRRYPVEIESLPMNREPLFRSSIGQYEGVLFHNEVTETGRIHPYPHAAEGFFIARLRKTDSLPIRPVTRPTRFAPSLCGEDDRVTPLLEQIEKNWGIPQQILQRYHFIRNQNKLWLMHPTVQKVPLDILIKAGLPLATKKTRAWKLSHAAVQFFEKEIHRSLLELPDAELRRLFCDGKIAATKSSLRYHVLCVQGRPFASVSQSEGEIKLRLPHRCEIIFDP